jgi:hypothetical protein
MQESVQQVTMPVVMESLKSFGAYSTLVSLAPTILT